MDNKKKEKKRQGSFRKFFSVPFFGKDKKKKEKESDIRQSSSHNNDNYQNETNCNSFVRNSPQRHTVGCDHSKNKRINVDAKYNGYNIQEEPSPEIIKQYANHHINKFRKIRQSFEYPSDDKLININGENNTDNPPRIYQEGIASSIAPHVTKYIDTSSSTSTLESGKQNSVFIQNEPQNTKQHEYNLFQSDDKLKLARQESLQRETPPRAQDTYQIVNIVKPKARLPINSGRPLPNPFQHDEESREYNIVERTTGANSTQENEETIIPQLNEIYGTVFDAVSVNSKQRESSLVSKKSSPSVPKSPSLEVSKLRLAPNREILTSQPRMQSPLPSTKVSTEKIIATELLKNSKPTISERGSRSNLCQTPEQSISPERHFNELRIAPQAESTPDDRTSVSEAINALRSELEVNDHNLKHELDQIKSTLQNLTHESPTFHSVQNVIKDEVDAHKVSPMGTLATSSRSSVAMSPSPQPMLAESLKYSANTQTYPLPSPNDEIVELRRKNLVSPKFGSQSSRSPTSPNKEEIRRSVEAYYWKEIKRIKEQEDYEIYLSHLHYSQGGYAEDPIFSRRSRGAEDNRARRSSSVPRSVRQHLSFDSSIPANRSVVIPEGRTVLYQPQRSDIYGYMPPKNPLLQTATRNTIQPSMPNGGREISSDYGTYKPIFRRGSLSGNSYQPAQINQYKKVSFSNSQQLENLPCWPTKNGFTKSPPQRRLDKTRTSTLEDDVFLPPSSQSHQNVHYQLNPDDYGRLRMRNQYNSETMSNYANSQNMDIYGYSSQIRNNRPTNYNSDSEALYSMHRQFKKLSHQEMENLRNSQLKDVNLSNNKYPVQMLSRHESIQLPEPTYGYANQLVTDRRLPYKTNSVNRIMGNQNVTQHPPRRDILITDNIYGQHIGYRNNTSGSVYGYSTQNNFSNEPLYVSKSVSVRNKVCDMYGRIHDTDSVHAQIQATGVLMGQLQNSPSSPNFRRGTRLTASSNDMLLRRRQANVEQSTDNHIKKPNTNQQSNNMHDHIPIRPLPPLPPTGRKIQNENSKSTSKKNVNSSKKKKK
ncbi:hypothetical protein WA026_003453 [Henosepilachna vigintioctopunctata]